MVKKAVSPEKNCSNNTTITLFQSIPNEIPRTPKKTEVVFKDVKLIEQLPCQKNWKLLMGNKSVEVAGRFYQDRWEWQFKQHC